MIPILYSASETSFTSEGLGRFAEAISCSVKEARNGGYELTMVYPANGLLFDLMDTGMFVMAKPNDTSNTQAFRIYKITTPLNGKVTIYAQHISYDLTGIPVIPFTTTGINATLLGIKNNSAITNDFTFTTNIVNTTTEFKLKAPTSARACLGGTDGSVLDLFSGSDSGEFEWDMKTVKFWSHRGSDNGVMIAYGKNMTDLNKEKTDESLYTGVMAYWINSESGAVVRGAIQYVTNHENYPVEKIFILDASSDFESQPTVEQLNARARTYRDANDVGVPRVNIKVSFVPLWQSEEYKNLAPLERVSLCDTVTVRYEKYGVDATSKVIETDYDVLKERYNSITLGDAKSRLGETIQQKVNDTVTKKTEETTSFLEEAIDHATELITGGDGGYVVISRDADGKPYELLIMDNPDKTQAINVIRMNQNGIGFSTNGYNGPFTTAWTIDGGFVADFIKSGTIDAINITGSNISGSVMEFGSGSETATMQTETVTNTIYNPAGGEMTRQYLAPTISGAGFEARARRAISFKSKTSAGDEEGVALIEPAVIHFETIRSNPPTGHKVFAELHISGDEMTGHFYKTVIEGLWFRQLPNGARHPFNSIFAYATRSNLVTSGTCACMIIGDYCMLQLADLTFPNADHNNANTDIAFANIPRAKHDVAFVVNTYGASSSPYYGHRLKVRGDNVYFHYDAASSYTSWQFYGTVVYPIADEVSVEDDGTWSIIPV